MLPSLQLTSTRSLFKSHSVPTNFKRMFALSAYKLDQPKTLQFQSTLPRLPVPSLDASIHRYLKSLTPLLLEKSSKDAKTNPATELKQREEWAKDFIKPGGLGMTLQERLRDVDRSTPNNWLDDAFWLKLAYHSWRVPLPVNSNWWLLMADDLSIPASVRNSIPAKGEFTDWQVKRAAKLTERLILFKVRLDRQEILPDSSRAGPFCMHQYTRVYGVTRVPQAPIDALVHSPHPHPSKHILVMVNDHFYKVDVMSGADGLDLASIEQRFWAVIDDAQGRPAGEGVGACSADERGTWTLAREHLLSLDPQNRSTLTAIEDALFVVALDAHTLKSDVYTSSSPVNKTPDLDAHIANACSGAGTGRNRWWDKAVSIVVESNGRGSMVGEHSPCDALIPSVIADYILAEGVDADATSKRGVKSEAVAFERLEWVLDAKAKENIGKAVETVKDLVTDSEGKMLWYDEYGADWIKKVGKQSPDAYLQMALQLAYHKTHNVAVATYETASTRAFLHGRTEVIRSLSTDSWKWVDAMRNGKHSAQQLYVLLTNATQAHNTYTRDSSTGKGCDRHFMGLKALMKPGESHPFFDDPLFSESQAWVLSTSGLSAGDRFFGTGFGTVWPNGYGINYLAGSKVVKFGIESKRSCEATSTEVFRSNLIEAMREMKKVCEEGQVVPLEAKL